jgi:ATP-dependent Clp protease ATP-binding subunit ClpA
MWRFAWWRRQDKPRWPTSFKETAARVCQLAERVARRHYHEYVGVEHVLLALLDAAPNPATELLRHCGLMPEQVRQAIEAVIEAGPGPVPRGRLPRTPNLERALIVAQAEKLQASSQASVVAVLLGLMAEERGLAGRVLSGLGVPPERIRQAAAEPAPTQE